MDARADEPRIIMVTESFDLCFECGPLASTLRRTGPDGRIGACAGRRR
jgi:hypothetical protein